MHKKTGGGGALACKIKMPENSYSLFQICAHLRRIKHVGICRYRRIENCTKSWNWGRRGGAAACKIKMPEEMVCIAL